MANKTKKIIKHLKSDMKMFKHEAAEDKKLVKSLSKKKDEKKKVKNAPKKNDKKKAKIEKVMHEYKEGELKSGSKRGPKVKSRKQAVAIALSEARRVGKKRKRK